MRHTEASGEWDGVDLATAPCLQGQVVGNVTGNRASALPSPYDAESGEKANYVHTEGTKLNGSRNAIPMPARPSTPPALLIYKPCVRYAHMCRASERLCQGVHFDASARVFLSIILRVAWALAGKPNCTRVTRAQWYDSTAFYGVAARVPLYALEAATSTDGVRSQ